MLINGTYSFTAPPEQVWQAICDPVVLKSSIPQCESIERLSDTQWRGTAKVKIALVKVSFTGLISLSNMQPPESYTLTIQAESWVGKANGHADVKLARSETGTILTYQAEVLIGIKLLDKAMNLADGLAKELADKFFGRLAEQMNQQQVAATHS